MMSRYSLAVLSVINDKRNVLAIARQYKYTVSGKKVTPVYFFYNSGK